MRNNIVEKRMNMKEKKVKLLVIFTLVLIALGLAGCGKKNYKTFPDKYTLSSVDVGGMTEKEAKKAIKKAIDNYQIKVKLDDAEFEMNAEDLGLEYNDKADMQTLINAANKNKEPDKQVKLFIMKKDEELQNALVDSYITARTEAQADSTSNTDNDTDDTKQADKSDAEIFDIKTVVPYRATITYNADAGQFEGVDGVSGDAPIYDKAATKLSSAVKEMKKKAELESSTGYVEGEKAADSDAIKKALKEAENIDFMRSDLFEELNHDITFNTIVSNPPYIPTKVIEGLQEEVRLHDPILALDGMEDGLMFYRKITAQAGDFLETDGYLCYEIGAEQAADVSDIMKQAGFKDITVVKDLAGFDRVVMGRK